MYFSTAVIAAFAASSLATPISKRAAGDVTVVKEEVFVYPDGEIVKTAWETYTTNVAKPTSVVQVAASSPAAVAPKPSSSSVQPAPKPSPTSTEAAAPSATGGAFLQSGGSSTPVSTNANSMAALTNINMGTSSYINAFAKSDVKTVSDVVPWSSDSSSLFARMSVFHHNVHRANSSLGALVWDEQLAQDAQNWANSCSLEEVVPDGKSYGMNAAWSSSAVGFNPSAWISEAWYNGELAEYPWDMEPSQISNDEKVNNSDGSNFKRYGHLTQVLWNTTVKVGCGFKPDCHSESINDQKIMHAYAGCYYSPPGNYAGLFASVGKPEGGPTVLPNGK